MKRRGFLKTVGLSAAAVASAGEPESSGKGPRRRNVLLYVTDDQGMDDAGCYGNPVLHTPGLDRLAREGTRFTHAFCTTASCSPSRSVILTGLHNHANGQYGLAHGYHHFVSMPNIKSLPIRLAAMGYRTVCAGKFHVEPEPLYHFDAYVKGRSPEEMADNCRDVIAGESDAPFFLYFCTTEPHRPFQRDGADAIRPNEVIVPPYLPDTPECREELAQYYMSVQRADSGLARLMDLLEAAGHLEDTLVVYISDNGIPFPGAKTTTYDPGIRLPCVVRSPFQAARGVVNNALITWADLTPTILDFAGAQVPRDEFHGRSFLPILEDKKPEGWDEAYMSHTFHEVTMYYPMRVVRGRKFKLIWNIAHGLEYPFASDLWNSATWQGVLKRGDTQYGKRGVEALLHRPKFELYDLENDPHEIHNLVDDPAHATVLEELQAKLRAFQERTKDPWRLKWERE